MRCIAAVANSSATAKGFTSISSYGLPNLNFGRRQYRYIGNARSQVDASTYKKGLSILISGLMIDVDGVLVRGRPQDGRAWHTALSQDLGIRYVDLYDRFFLPYWEGITLGRDDLRVRLTPILADLAPNISVDDLLSYWHSHDAAIDLQFLDSVQHIRKRGIPAFIATNQGHERGRYLWEDLGLNLYFDDIIYSAQIGCRKPDRDFYKAAETRVGIAPEQLLLVDDTEANVHAARREGWQALYWSRPNNFDLAERILHGCGINHVGDPIDSQ